MEYVVDVFAFIGLVAVVSVIWAIVKKVIVSQRYDSNNFYDNH